MNGSSVPIVIVQLISGQPPLSSPPADSAAAELAAFERLADLVEGTVQPAGGLQRKAHVAHGFVRSTGSTRQTSLSRTGCGLGNLCATGTGVSSMAKRVVDSPRAETKRTVLRPAEGFGQLLIFPDAPPRNRSADDALLSARRILLRAALRADGSGTPRRGRRPLRRPPDADRQGN